MPAQKIGINFTNLDDLTAPQFDFANNTEDFLNDIPIKANEITHGLLGVIVLSGLFIFLYWKLSQENFYGGDFSYSKLRSLGIASSICSVLGLVSLNMGYFTNFYHIVIFIIVSFISAGVVWRAEK